MPTLLVAMEIILATINVILMATITSPSEVVVQIARSISLTAMLGNPTRKYSAASSMWMVRVRTQDVNSMITARMMTWRIFVRSTTSGKKRRNIVKVIITHVAAEADPEADHAHALVVLTAAAAVAATAATRMMGPVLK
jgi:hypothetical protein